MDQSHLLINRLKDYSKSPMYPFHMPGHKRLKGSEGSLAEFDFPNPFSVDITEIEGFDNLHHPEGILKESMEWAAEVYGSDRTWYLVNGSSCGILSAISAVFGGGREGGRLLMARNCHKASYHGAYLNGLKVSYVYPQTISELGIQGGILPEDVEKALENEPDIKAVMLVSPTYDGIVSDIHRIGEIVHKWKIPLIVDEAHGAHFPFGAEFPASALELGADLVIQSVHKTLPSLTQTAVLHFKRNEKAGGPFVDVGRLERFLQIYQSSSPSYVLMASIENGIFQMERLRERRGLPGNRMDFYWEELGRLRACLRGMENLCLVGGRDGADLKGLDGVFDLDLTKIVVSGRRRGINGPRLDHWLRRDFSLEMEMCGADYVTAITTCFDGSEGLRRLGDGLMKIDQALAGDQAEAAGRKTEPLPKAKVRCPLQEAMDGTFKRMPFEKALGEVSSEFVYVYPPGIPILAPGEEITGEVLRLIFEYQKQGLPVQGPEDHSLKMIKVME